MSFACVRLASRLLASALLFTPLAIPAFAQAPVKVAIVGLVHGHVQGFLRNLPSHSEIQLVGVAEPDAGLRQKYASLFNLPQGLFFPSEKSMLAATHPQAILVYTSIADHRSAI